MISRVFAMVVLMAMAMPSGAEQLEFKGVPFGATLEAFKELHPRFECTPHPQISAQMLCSVGVDLCRRFSKNGCGPNDFAESKYADERVNMIIAIFVDGTFERLEVYFQPSAYDSISSALVGKYGKPTVTDQTPYATVGGAKTLNDTKYWKLQNKDAILIERYGDNLTQGQMFLVSKKFVDSSVASDAERKAKQGKGM